MQSEEGQMSPNHSSRQVKPVRGENATAGSASEDSIKMSSANSWFFTRGGRMHESELRPRGLRIVLYRCPKHFQVS